MRLLFFLILLSGFNLEAQDFLWKVSHHNLEHDSYIFALWHSAESGMGQDLERIYPYIDESSAFVSTQPQSATDRNQIRIEMLQVEQKGLKKSLGKKEYSLLSELVRKRLGDDVLSYDQWAPCFLRQELVDASSLKSKRSFSDEMLYEYARIEGKKKKSLFNAQQLGAAQSSVDYESQINLLSNYVQLPQVYEEGNKALLRYYLEGDFNLLQNKYKALLGQQQAYWTLEAMEEELLSACKFLLEKESSFLAIRAEFLDQAFWDSLENQAYNIEPVFIPGLFDNLRQNAWIGNLDEFSSDTETEEVSVELTSIGESRGYKALFPDLNGIPDLPQDAYVQANADPFVDLSPWAEHEMPSSWFHYQSPSRDYEVKFPHQPQLSEKVFQTAEGSIRIKLQILNDPISQIYYLSGKTAYPPGYSPSNLKRFFDQAVQGIRKQFDGDIIAQRVMANPLYTGRQFVLELSSGQLLRGQMILVDQYLYQVIAAGDEEDVYGIQGQTFMSSFAIQSKQLDRWENINHPSFQAQVPGAFTQDEKILGEQSGSTRVELWSCEENSSGVLYFISLSHYNEEQIGSPSKFLDDIIYSASARLSGRIVEEEKIKEDGVKGREIILESRDKRYRIQYWLDGGDLIQVMASASSVRFYNSDIDYFFEQFKLRK